MPDDLDDNIRAAMKTLDDEVPSGYFDALPNQILARLEDGNMQHGSTSNVRDKQRDALTGPPVAATAAPAAQAKKTETTEDSGLHDIRNLAQSTKQRLSNKRITSSPPMSDDVLASSSGSWKNIALPEPAKMVSLPDLASLPSKAEILAAEKLEAKRLAEETKAKARSKKGDKSSIAPPLASDEVLAPVATANAALDAMSAKPAAIPERQAFSLPSQQNKRSKAPLLAVLGLGVAAAAGGVIYMQMNKGDEAKTTAAATAPTVETIAQAAPEPAKEAEPAPVAPPAAEAAAAAAGSAVEAVAAAAGSAADGDDAGDDTGADDKVAAKTAKRGGKGKKVVEKEKAPPLPEIKTEEKKPEAPKVEPKKAGGKEGEGEPSFDALLKEAGVDGQKKEAKPVLDKKSLSADDFKKGMSGIAGKAQGCYKGTQGTAMVKLTVGPTGKVTKASVSGSFAGTPEASCVESAVKSASFPPWDGGPQSFTYSYMLSD
jgi:hypothetical protein